MSDPRPLCVIGEKQHEARVGLLCEHHFEQLGVALRIIEDEAAILDSAPSLAGGNYDQPNGGALASHQAPARVNVVVLTDPRRGELHWAAEDFDELALDSTPSVLETLGTWARMVREERALADPSGPATVSGERELLTRQLLWIAEQAWVDEFNADITALAKTLQRTNNTLDIPAGACTDLVNGSECGGNVWHVLIKPDGKVVRGDQSPDRRDEPGFRCSRCRAVWTGTEAVRKRDRMWRDEQARKAAQR